METQKLIMLIFTADLQLSRPSLCRAFLGVYDPLHISLRVQVPHNHILAQNLNC